MGKLFCKVLAAVKCGQRKWLMAEITVEKMSSNFMPVGLLWRAKLIIYSEEKEELNLQLYPLYLFCIDFILKRKKKWRLKFP